ncbi:hypothetical protein [Sciscionella marina]|uniref:hypothetical protein n=1 Tax=Sciscionella marina TaxID=508770 RepID=UPI00036D3A66|nr:hypothetical protein [Sciscionella marina]
MADEDLERVRAEIEALRRSLAALPPKDRKKLAKPLKKLLLEYAAGEHGEKFDEMLLDAAVDKALDYLTDELF